MIIFRQYLSLIVLATALLALQGCAVLEKAGLKTNKNNSAQAQCDFIGNLGAPTLKILDSTTVTLLSAERECSFAPGVMQHQVRLNFTAKRSSTRRDNQGQFAYYVTVFNSNADVVSRQIIKRSFAFQESQTTVHFTDFVTLERPFDAQTTISTDTSSLPHYIAVGFRSQQD